MVPVNRGRIPYSGGSKRGAQLIPMIWDPMVIIVRTAVGKREATIPTVTMTDTVVAKSIV